MLKKRKISAEELAFKVLYFAYGSNMFQERLENRVGNVTCLGAYTLPGYELTFDTGTYFECFANVKRSEKKSCQGVIYEMTYGQLLQLDWYEGLYVRIKETYKERRLHLYISDKHRDEERVPEITQEYRTALIRGCMDHGLTKSLKIIQKIALVQRRPMNYLNSQWESWYD